MRIGSHVRAFVLVVGVALLGATVAVAASHSTRGIVSARTTSIGKVLVDRNGHTLYLFQKDRRGMSACTGSCASFWPALMAKGKPVVGAGAKQALVGTIKRGSGRQVTYNGHPLYRFSLDSKAGQTKGEGLDDFGARWYAMSPAGKALVSQSTSNGGSGSGSGGGGGYPYP